MEIAGLANLDKGEQNNVFCNPVLEPKDKARKILTMINEEPTFSRKKLCGYLKELNLCEEANEVLNGTLRSQSSDDAASQVPSSNEVQ